MRSIRRSHASLFLIGLLLATSKAASDDWPMWRRDAARRASSRERLPERLRLLWVLELPFPRPAWPSVQPKLQFDRLYEPVLLGKTLFVPSMLSDALAAYDTETGKERWRFRADGPVRFAAAAWEDKVYFCADDGCLYCLDAANGALLWKLRGGPSDRKVLGNDRLISAWPARGAPVILDGRVYFAAGIWPFMGTFVYCVDARTGRVLWENSGTGSTFGPQQHDSPAFAGVAPQGYLAAGGDWLLVPGGRTVPAAFHRATGELRYFDPSSREMGIKGGGGYEVLLGDGVFVNRGFAYELETGKYLAPLDGVALAGDEIIGVLRGAIRGFRHDPQPVETVDARGRKVTKPRFEQVWKLDPGTEVSRVFLRSGDRAYASSTRHEVLAVDLPAGDDAGKVSWRVRLEDEPLNAIAGDAKLFVSTASGRIYCFGAGEADAPAPRWTEVTIVPRGSRWKYSDRATAPPADWLAPDFDDSSWASGPAQLGYGDGDEKTVLRFGDDPARKPMACWFRHSFRVDEPPEEATLKVLVDDGAVAWLNGVEVGRIHMPSGRVGPETAATKTVEDGQFLELSVPPERIQAGRNVLAVAVHQASASSSDLSFDLELEGTVRPSRRLPKLPEDAASERTRRILGAAPGTEGLCLVLGAASARIAEEVAVRTSMQVAILEESPAEVARARARLESIGLDADRVAVLPGRPGDPALPPYVVELALAEGPWTERLAGDAGMLRAVLQTLRPGSGAACLDGPPAALAAVEAAVAAPELEDFRTERTDGLGLIRRVRPPKGSGTWTHQYGTAANTVASAETAARSPLGILWFGGPSHEGILPRHGHGPTPQAVDGRLIIEGRDLLRATDLYTGRLLWQADLPGVGEFYDYESHEPGANAIGSNYVSLEDGIWVAHRRQGLRLDPRTGSIVDRLELPPLPDGTRAPEWGYLGAIGDLLVAGAGPSDFLATDYTAAEIGKLKEERIAELLAAVETWQGFQRSAGTTERKDEERLLEDLNRLLDDPGFLSRIPSDVRAKAKAETTEAQLAEARPATGSDPAGDGPARFLRRALLAKYYGLPAPERKPAGMFGSSFRIWSRRLHGLDRRTGAVLWSLDARYGFRHNAIALGGGKVFCIDRTPDAERSFRRRRGLAPEDDGSLSCLDAGTGRVLWSSTTGIFGTWLGYSEEHDVLLEAGSASRDRLLDEVGKGMAAYRGATGDLLWRHDEAYGGPAILIGRRAITQVQGSGGIAFDLLTGRKVSRIHPLSGEEIPWSYGRNYGCNTAIGCPTLLTFRSAAAGYYDLATEGGTGNFGGFRSGCTSNLIPAGGLVVAPDYTRTCTCAYQNQTSLALVHMPEVETWTFAALPRPEKPIRRLGLNFGAPGDRLSEDGTLWLDAPSVGGPSPDPEVKVSIEGPRYLRRHSSRVTGDLPWVAASAVSGSGDIVVRLAQAASGVAEAPVDRPPASGTVRLVFAELDDVPQGGRVFDVALQGAVAVRDLDIVREAGGRGRSLVKEIPGIPLGAELRISLVPKAGAAPVLSGIEIVADD